MWVRSLGQEGPLEKGRPLTSVFLPGESHGQRSLVGYSQRVAKSRTGLSDFTFTTMHTHTSSLSIHLLMDV